MSKTKPRGITRRDFVGVSIGTVVVAGVGCSSSSTNPSTSGGAGTSPSTGGSSGAGNGGASAVGQGGATESGGQAATGGTTPAATAATGGATANGTSASPKLVCLARNTDGIQAALDAIAGAGGLPDLSGKTVVLKLNLLQNSGPPCTTSAAVVVGVVKAASAKNAKKIIIGDCSMGVGAMAVLQGTSSGIDAALKAAGLTYTLMDFSAGGAADLVQVKPTGAAKWPNGFHMWKAVLDDGSGSKPFVINMPCCKHHSMATWSLAMKNWIGLLPHGEVAGASTSGVADDRATAHNVITAGLAELHLAVKEDFVVLDAMKAQLTGGPGNGAANTQGSPGIVVASADAVAAEATGLAILREYRSRMSTVPGKDAIENTAIFSTDTSTLMGRALSLGNGWITNRQAYNYLAIGLGADEQAIIARLDS